MARRFTAACLACAFWSCSGSGADGDVAEPLDSECVPDLPVADGAMPDSDEGAATQKLPLSTSGRYIVDAGGNRVRLVGVNWNGAHEDLMVPHGLAHHPPDVIAARIAELGFNSVRLTWSNELVETDPMPEAADVAGWPEAAGMSSMQVFDRVVEALTAAGIFVILNNHMSDSGWCCNEEDGNGLWYNEAYPEDAWIADWVALAQRYLDNPMVVAADLRNELRQKASWEPGGDPAYDWPSAAERCGEALLAVRPDWLIIVEGTDYAVNLEGVADRPVHLSVPGKLVYSAHNYPWSVTSIMPTPELFATMVHDLWGYVMEPPDATPVWLGEFGTCNTCWGDPWVSSITTVITGLELGWALWLLFGTPDGWGLLSEETLEVNTPDILPLLEQWGAMPPGHR